MIFQSGLTRSIKDILDEGQPITRRNAIIQQQKRDHDASDSQSEIQIEMHNFGYAKDRVGQGGGEKHLIENGGG